MDFKRRELRFGVTDGSRFNAEDLKSALKAQGFPDAAVRSGPLPLG
jgi:hypothetical protein